MRVALEICSKSNVTKATELCGDGCDEPIKIHCNWETLPMQEQPREKASFVAPFWKVSNNIWCLSLYQDTLDSNLWLRSQRPHPISSPMHAPPLSPCIRCDALFHCDSNNHTIIVWVHTSYQEIKKNLYRYLWFTMTINNIYGSDF